MTSDRTLRRDAGMTLIELVVTISVIGAIAMVLAAAVTVTFRQHADTNGNLDVARWEQALALWLPTDLASADPSSLSDDPSIAPTGCSLPECANGSNALQLSFDDGSGATTVSYRYTRNGNGDGFVLIRVECRGGSCSARVVLEDLAAPSDAGWAAGDPVPAGVISVSVPLQVVDASSPSEADVNAVTVSVTVNGIPDGSGVDRSSSVSITAGGVVRSDLPTPAFKGPSFIEARSGCGGPVTLIVDESGSIGAADVDVRRGVESFVRAFEGTPTQLKVITFSWGAQTIGTSGWHRAFDLSEPSDVFELVGDATLGVGGYLPQIDSGGSTNWQEALVRAYYTDATGTTRFADAGDPSRPAPELVVFFTDGSPTRDIGRPTPPPEYDHSGNNAPGDFTPRSWYRANTVAEANRSSGRLIGVGVGPTFGNSTLVDLPGWPTYEIPDRVFLGDLIAGLSTPIVYNGVDERFELVEYDGSWGDVSTADVLTTGDFTQLGSGLAAIALAECGGTLTVQTREPSGDPADASVTYTLNGLEQATTTRINKAVPFDVPFEGAVSATVQLVPEPLDGSGYAATGWTCSAGGVAFTVGTEYSLIAPGDPTRGIEVTVTPNAAVSCTLEVVRT